MNVSEKSISDQFDKNLQQSISVDELERDKKAEENQQHKDIFKFRTEYYKKLFIAICVYIGLVFATIWFNKVLFGLEGAILITLLSTTTVNVLGAFYIASKWVFPNKE